MESLNLLFETLKTTEVALENENIVLGLKRMLDNAITLCSPIIEKSNFNSEETENLNLAFVLLRAKTFFKNPTSAHSEAAGIILKKINLSNDRINIITNAIKSFYLKLNPESQFISTLGDLYRSYKVDSFCLNNKESSNDFTLLTDDNKLHFTLTLENYEGLSNDVKRLINEKHPTFTNALYFRYLIDDKNANLNFYLVTAKCGHVGKNYYIPITFAISAQNASEAAAKAREIPRVKHHHKDAILSVVNVDSTEYRKQSLANEIDPYLLVTSVAKQKELNIEEQFKLRLVEECEDEPKYSKKQKLNQEPKSKRNKPKNKEKYTKTSYNQIKNLEEGDFY